MKGEGARSRRQLEGAGDRVWRPFSVGEFDFIEIPISTKLTSI